MAKVRCARRTADRQRSRRASRMDAPSFRACRRINGGGVGMAGDDSASGLTGAAPLRFEEHDRKAKHRMVGGGESQWTASWAGTLLLVPSSYPGRNQGDQHEEYRGYPQV